MQQVKDMTAFRRLWASTGASNLADGILLAGLPVLATTVTTSPGLIAGVQVALMGPMALSALPSGVLADRIDRRTVIVAADVLRAVGLLAVLVLGWREEWRLAAIYLAAALAGSTEVMADSAAETSVPDLVDPARLGAAHSRLMGTQVVLNHAVGAPIGGVVAAAGIGWLFTLPAALYALAGGIVRNLHLPPPTEAPSADPAAIGSTIKADLREGLAFVWRHRTLRRIGVANATMNVGNTAIFAVAVLLVIGPLGLPRSSYGVVLSLFAAGGVLGTLVQGRLVGLLGHRRVLVVSAAVAGSAYGLICLTAEAWVAAPAAVAVGAFSMVWNVANRVLRQRLTPPAMLGRVSATMRLMSLMATPLGALLGGAVAEVAGVRSVGVVAVVAAAVAGTLLWRIDSDTAQVEGAPPGVGTPA